MDMDSNRWLQESPRDFVDVVLHHAAVRPDKTACRVISPELGVIESITFADLDRRARAIAHWFRGRIEAGGRALLAYPTGIDFLTAFCGCLYARVIAVPIYIPGKRHARAENAARIARNCECACVLTRSDKLQPVSEWVSGSGLRNIPVLASDTVDPGLSGQWRIESPGRDAIAFLQYTSGSTGTPKGVIVRHGNLVHNQQLIMRALRHSEDTRIVSWLPLYHDMGLIAAMLQSIFVGGDLVLMAPQTFLQKPDIWLRAIGRFRGTSTFAPNFAYELCCERLGARELSELDLSSLRLAVNGAEPIRSATLEKFANHFRDAGFRASAHCPAYGLAEATVFVSSARRGEEPRITHLETSALRENRVVQASEGAKSSSLVCVGPLDTDQDIRIVNPDSRQVCPPDEVGEIWIRGRSITTGYWKNEPADWGVLADSEPSDGTPFLRTGDLGSPWMAGFMSPGASRTS
jgi:acyl-CoA synthetase (AMP-forming)/AMP-acid ligase II